MRNELLYGKKSSIVMTLLLSVYLMGCTANYGLDLGQNKADDGGGPVAAIADDPNPPDIGTDPDPGTDPDDDPNPPDIGEEPLPPDIGTIIGNGNSCSTKCEVKILVKIKQISFKDEYYCRIEQVPFTDVEVDLCALSKDFFGTLNSGLKPQIRDQEKFKKIELVLESSGHRIMMPKGVTKVCDLTIPAGLTSSLRVVPSPSPMAYDVTKLAGFAFSQEYDVIKVGDSECQFRTQIMSKTLRLK